MERVSHLMIDIESVQAKERDFMAQVQIVCLLRPGTQEQWRRLYQEVAGSRREPFEVSCQQAGITQVHVRLVQTLRGELMLMKVHMQEPNLILRELLSSQRPFDRWLREQLQGLLGWNIQEMLVDGQGDLIFAWAGERRGGLECQN